MDAYEITDPKHPDYRERATCVHCAGVNGHYAGCIGVGR